jgi:hypothetical protein
MEEALQRVDAKTMFVADPKRSKSCYEAVFDRPPVYEDATSVAFRLENLIVNLLVASAATELVSPADVADSDGHIWEVAQDLPPQGKGGSGE